ncbi:MAG: hypothetical protein AB1397_01200 [bacterium]
MLVDVVKYIITVGVIGSLFTDKLTTEMAVIAIITSLGFLLVAFFVIPEEVEKGG